MRDTKVERNISVVENTVIINDKWASAKPVTMRQRFVLPECFIEKSLIKVKERVFESEYGNVNVIFSVFTEENNVYVGVNFGVASPNYNTFESAILLDTICENSMNGEITTKIIVSEVQE